MIFFSFNFQYDMGPIWGKIEQNARKTQEIVKIKFLIGYDSSIVYKKTICSVARLHYLCK